MKRTSFELVRHYLKLAGEPVSRLFLRAAAPWTVEGFIRKYYAILPLVDYRGANRSHSAAFVEACALHMLQIKCLGEGKYQILRGSEKIGTFQDMSTDTGLNGTQAKKICGSKLRTVSCLKRANVPVPEQHAFRKTDFRLALRVARQRGFNVVVKPELGRGGFGITTAIQNEGDFRQAWAYAIESTASKRRPSSIVVESKYAGVDIRAIVVDGCFVCAATRIPANIVGDGVSTVSTLIEHKNILRKANSYHGRHPIRIDNRLVRQLEAAELTFDSVLPKDEPLVLSDVANVHGGGDACDVTALLCSRIKEVAERAAGAVPDLRVAGVDLIVSNFDDRARVTVIEINAYANFSVHYGALRGMSRNPAEAVVLAMMRLPNSMPN